MTLLVDRGADGPRVHVLAIGVGAYRHLPRGSEPVQHDTMGLQQLSGPPLSARLFVDWVTNSMKHPRAQLGTIELLTSPGTDGIDVPSLDATRKAFDAWYKRCNASKDNVGIFYFCGHGVEKDSAYLLLEDFGASENRLLENAVDIGTTYEAMARCKAREQYFFVDACREIPFNLRDLLSGTAEILVDLKTVGDARSDTALMFATAKGTKAYGRTRQPTRFTEALVRALNGLGSRPDTDGSGWVVDVPSLQRAVTALLESDVDGAPGQRPSMRATGIGALHEFVDSPVMPISISCNPTAAVPAATVTLEPLNVGGGSVPSNASPRVTAMATGWTVEAPADIYELTVDFPDGAYKSARARVLALPPGLPLGHVEVTP